MAGETFHSQSSHIVAFTQWPLSIFTRLSGGAYQSETTLVHPGGRKMPVGIEGPGRISQISLEKPYEPTVDAPLVAWMRAHKAGVTLPGTLQKSTVASNGLPVGDTIIYIRCHLDEFTPPDHDQESGDPAMLRITVTPEDMQ